MTESLRGQENFPGGDIFWRGKEWYKLFCRQLYTLEEGFFLEMYAGIRDAVIFFLSGIVESTRKCRLIYGNQIEIDRSYPPWMFSVFLYGE